MILSFANTSKIFKGFAVLVFLFCLLFVFSPKTYAATQAQCDADRNATLVGLPKWYKYIESTPDDTGKCTLNFSGDDNESKLNSALPIGIAILEIMLRLAGVVAVIMVFWGGFKYITAQGNPDNAKGARTTIINAMIGLVIVILSTAIVSFIGRSI
jgi:hypothetical protein